MTISPMNQIPAEAKKLVLVVEDDVHIANLLNRILEREGYQVRTVNDGEAALKIILSSAPAPALVLLDLSLPFVDGLTVLGHIVKADSWLETRVIVLSGKIEEQEISKALTLGADDYITKPFQLGELVARVNRTLKKK